MGRFHFFTCYIPPEKLLILIYDTDRSFGTRMFKESNIAMHEMEENSFPLINLEIKVA